MNEDVKEKSFEYALDPDKIVQTITLSCPYCNEPLRFNVNLAKPLHSVVKTCLKCGSSLTIDLSKAKPWICDTCGETFRTKTEVDEGLKLFEDAITLAEKEMGMQ